MKQHGNSRFNLLFNELIEINCGMSVGLCQRSPGTQAMAERRAQQKMAAGGLNAVEMK